MDLFGAALPDVLVHRNNYGFQLYCIGQIMAGQVRQNERMAQGDFELPASPELAKQAVGLVEMLYHGVHNLDIRHGIQVPHEMLLGMNTSQIVEVYAGSWLLKMDAKGWRDASNRHDLWQVVGAARKRINESSLDRYLLQRLDKLCGKTYLAEEAGSLPSRLRQLPPSVSTQFMQAFTEPFRSPGSTSDYTPVRRLKKGLDVVVFEHFARRFAEGERQLSLHSSTSSP